MRNFISFYILIYYVLPVPSRARMTLRLLSSKCSEVGFDAKLRDVLIQKGFSFNENGELICDNQVLNTTSLNLSRCGLTSISGLRSFPFSHRGKP